MNPILQNSGENQRELCGGAITIFLGQANHRILYNIESSRLIPNRIDGLFEGFFLNAS
jgi:hypothetical protein